MDARRVSQSTWLQLYILGASALLALVSLGNSLLFTQTLATTSGKTPLESAIMLTGVFIAFPLGLVNINLGWSGLRAHPGAAGKTVAITGLVTGVLGVLTGLFWYGALFFLLTGGFR